MSTKLGQEILFLAARHRTFSVGEIQAELKKPVSRQYISREIKGLVETDKLARIGSGRWTKYALPKEMKNLSERAQKKLKNNRVLDEDRIYAELKRKVRKLRELPNNVERIVSYAFTEMLNNAIDHSKSKSIKVSIVVDPNEATFTVEDFGIGIFKNIQRTRGLNNELEAIQDLTKGKVTTMKERHTGEGVFFTSRVSDLLEIESYGYRYRVDNEIDDVFIERIDSNNRGTLVKFKIDVGSKKDLGKVFRSYQVDSRSGEFDVTEVRIKLFKEEVEYISRSQAKRVLVDLEKFKRIVLDFENVNTVGQGFTDEVFRVFQADHSDIELVPENMNEEVSFMVNRVEKPQPKLGIE